MSVATERQTAKISSLDAARAIYFIVAGLAVRQALLFLVEPPITPTIPLWARFTAVIAYLFTLFRFSHGTAVVYELEKKSTETTTSPSSMKVEQVFGLFMIEAVSLFLMSLNLATPYLLVMSTLLLLAADLGYVAVSKTVRDITFGKIMWPPYLVKRPSDTRRGTAPHTHLQWAQSDWILGLALATTLFRKLPSLERLTTGSYVVDWLVSISVLLIIAGVVDYWANRAFYFGATRHKRRRCVFVSRAGFINASG